MRSLLDRTVAAMVGVAEDPAVPARERVAAGAVIRSLLKSKPPRKRRSAAVAKLLREMGAKPAPPN